MNLLLCLFEAQDDSLCDFVAKQLGSRFSAGQFTMSCLHYLALGYFLSAICRTTKGLFELDLGCIDDGDLGLEMESASELSILGDTHASSFIDSDTIIASLTKELSSLQLYEGKVPGRLAIELVCSGLSSSSFTSLSCCAHTLTLIGPQTKDFDEIELLSPRR